MRKLIKNATGFQTLLNLGVIAGSIIIAIRHRNEFIIFDISGMNETYFFVGGFMGMVFLSEISIWRTYKKNQRSFLFQNEALAQVSKRFSIISSINGFFCFTFSTSVVGNYGIAEVFSSSWALLVFTIGCISWYMLLYLSVFIGRMLFYSAPETTLDQTLWEEQGDF